MARRKSNSDQYHHLDKVALDKPDFERALSFAEELMPSVQAPDAVQPTLEYASLPPGVPARIEMQAMQLAPTLMPQDEPTRKILEKRARVIALQADEQENESRSQYLRFRLGAVERYGIPYQYLEELLYVGNLARVPCTPDFIAGVVNHRGELLTILDLKYFFRMPPVARGEDARIIVVKHDGVRVGLLVDEVDGNEEYPDSTLSSPLSSEGVSNMEYVLGIHAGSVTLLDVSAFLEDASIQVNR
jgi:purine-binding chemotaxis protein CheW